MSRRALVFGAGRVACGALGKVLVTSGFDTTFVARRAGVIGAIARAHGYTLEVAGQRTIFIPAAGALDVSRPGPVIDAIAESDVVFTALGVDGLRAVAPLLARGLWLRSTRRKAAPLPIIACENLPGAGAYLSQVVLDATSPVAEVAVQEAGRFSSALTHCIISEVREERGLLVVVADQAADLVIDEVPLAGVAVSISGSSYTDRFAAAVMRKLFVLNCAHAAAAYHGHQAGCTYLHEAMALPDIAGRVRAVLSESAAALTAEFPADAAVIASDAAAAFRRISNAELRDPVRRVAKDPRRKLVACERLLGPARLAQRHGLAHHALVDAAVAALLYDEPSDPQARSMRGDIEAWGLDHFLAMDCGLLPQEALARAIARAWEAVLLRGVA